MVGVPGKYKGCETCRGRRVKCDNQRPYCKKCLDSGRQCAGYERETVFIIGTVEDEGRCSSHPPRVVKATAKRGGRAAGAAKKRDGEERLAPVPLVPTEPLQPAWDDLVILAATEKKYAVQIAALQTSLQGLVRRDDEADPSKPVLISLPPYEPSIPQPSVRDQDFELRCQCLVHLDEDTSSHVLDVDETDTVTTDSICLFLYEMTTRKHNNSVTFSNQAPWRDPSIQGNVVRQLGPASFRTFPSHHFFVRVYRPSGICAALLNRKPSFLASPEWLTTPWEFHPKSFFDHLLDIIVLLPSIFARADRIFAHDPTLQRQLMAQDLLANCLHLERQLDQWYAGLDPNAAAAAASSHHHHYHPNSAAGTGGPGSSAAAAAAALFWIQDDPDDPSSAAAAQIPFAPPLAFRDGLTATALIHYWAALVLFLPCVERLREAIFQRAMDAFPLAEPPALLLPAQLQQQQQQQIGGGSDLDNLNHLDLLSLGGGSGGLGYASHGPADDDDDDDDPQHHHHHHDPLRHSTAARVRDLAAAVCRGLDAALAAAVQPDLLLGPLGAVHDFYRAVGESASGHDGQLEGMWCEAFRARLAARGSDMAEVVQGKRWRDLGAW